jgi:hypothetical protein
MDAYEETERAKYEAEERAKLEEPITLPPGSADEGELTTHPASAPEDEEQLAAIEDEGPVPLSYGKLPLSYVRSEGEGDLPKELTKKVPPETGTDPEFPGRAREPEARNPIGISW